MRTAIRLVELGLVPTPLIRHGIRRLIHERLDEERLRHASGRDAVLGRFAETMRSSDVALVPEKANEQHYELPPEFFRHVLGARLKYSSAFFPLSDTTLDEAEELMLGMTADRARLEDGQRVLELGCGWGSLTLWMAAHYPNSSIVAVSNSAQQRDFILAQAETHGLRNVTVLTRDMNRFEPDEGLGPFDRIVSVEMFEHMRNWEALLGRLATWLHPDGRVFLHVFAHRLYAYPFEARDDSDWMSRYFFTGGMMPSEDLVERIESPFEIDDRWTVGGQHYARTSECWLRNLDANRDVVLPLLRATYGERDAETWFRRWRVFFLACAELFGFEHGSQWVVSHQRLRLKPGVRA